MYVLQKKSCKLSSDAFPIHVLCNMYLYKKRTFVWVLSGIFQDKCYFHIFWFKVEKIYEDSLDLIPSPSPSVKNSKSLLEVIRQNIAG